MWPIAGLADAGVLGILERLGEEEDEDSNGTGRRRGEGEGGGSVM